MKPPMYNSKDGKPPVNRRVIVINNEPGPPILGTLVRYEPITRSNSLTPVIREDGTNREYITLGTVLPYSDRLYDMIKAVPEDGLTWTIFRDIRWFRLDMDAYCKFGEESVQELLNALTEPAVPAPLPPSGGLWNKVWKSMGFKA